MRNIVSQWKAGAASPRNVTESPASIRRPADGSPGATYPRGPFVFRQRRAVRH
jgi:hypothetical protein